MKELKSKLTELRKGMVFTECSLGSPTSFISKLKKRAKESDEIKERNGEMIRTFLRACQENLRGLRRNCLGKTRALSRAQR